MTAHNPKSLFQKFLQGHEGYLHFAAHSHHFWPDISREGQLQYWDDSALLSDRKWNKIFSEVIPQTQKHIAKILNLRSSKQIVFAPNTHELTVRLLSLFLDQGRTNILTTDHEFHSWKRQISRLEENSNFTVTKVRARDLVHDKKSFIDELKAELKKPVDLFYISQVFFDSGIALTTSDLIDLQKACSPETLMVVDGYHGFGALPTDLSALEGKIFYLGGGYKYAQAGEGVGFLVLPEGSYRPAYTGWFAEYEGLSKSPGKNVGYAPEALGFMGATQDFSGLYRFNSIWNHFETLGINVQVLHDHALKLQKHFLELIESSIPLKPLFDPSLEFHGHFLTYEGSTLEAAEAFEKSLKGQNILIDRRGNRVRFGFGYYQDFVDVETLVARLKKLS